MKHRLLSSDIDGTLAGDGEATLRFATAWRAVSEAGRPLLCFNTGRPVDDAREFTREIGLPEPDYIIGGVGTEIYDVRKDRLLKEYHDSFGGHWDLAAVERIVESVPGIMRQPPEFLHPYKSSWFLTNAGKEHLRDLEESLKSAGIHACVIYSSSIDLDVLPADANKGNAVKWLANQLSIDLSEVIVAGDSGNDTSMFFVPRANGIIVGNAQPELLEVVAGLHHYKAGAKRADGVLEGLRHFGVPI